MGAQGTATLDFGAFPGASDASVVVTGQAGIVAGSLVEAWVYPLATADHSADEHMLESFRVFAHSIVAGTGFTISGFNTSELSEPVDVLGALGRFSGTGTALGRGKQEPGATQQAGGSGGRGTRIYGTWTIGWVWN